MMSIWLCKVVIVTVFISVGGQSPQSPCPGTFEYENDGYNVYGVIRLVPKGPISYVQIRVNFTIAAQLFNNYLGSLNPVGNNQETLNRGEALKYRVDFPVKSPLPKLTGLTVNGKVLCYAQPDYPRPNQILTSITLDHTLYTTSGYTGFGNPFPSGINAPVTQTEVEGYKPIEESSRITETLTTNNVVIDTWPELLPGQTNYGPYGWPPPTQLPPTRPPPTQPPPTQPPPTQPPPIKPPRRQTPKPSTPVRLPTFVEEPPPSAPAPSGGDQTQYQCGRPTVLAPLIVGGEEYLRGEIPWLVALSKQKGQNLAYICSGSLVSNRHVVTAAHCMQLRETTVKLSTMVVTVGAFDLNDVTDDFAKRFYIEHATPHSSYDPFTLKNDILVLTLTKQVVFSDYIIPVCLWDDPNTDLNAIVNKKGTVAGWGTNEQHEAGRGRPRRAKIPIVSTETCQKSHDDFIKLTSESTLCAGDKMGTSPCNGDSGGGLYMRKPGQPWMLRGIISVSLNNEDDDSQYECNIQQYIVLTDAAKYTQWLKTVMAETQT